MIDDTVLVEVLVKMLLMLMKMLPVLMDAMMIMLIDDEDADAWDDNYVD